MTKAPDDLIACRNSLRGGSRSFFAASLLLPADIRDPAAALYAFCRLADDEIDTAERRVDALDDLHDRLERIYAGQPYSHPADRAVAPVVDRFTIPKTLPLALLEGFAWDADGRRYQDIEDLFAYATRVAGTVGVMMALVMGVRSPQAIARACDLGLAMQLSNIARDVGEDARAGRLYLPVTWMREAGLDPDAFLASPSFTPALATVVERLLRVAEVLYRRADDGIAALPLSCRPGIRAARRLYAEIGYEVARRGFDSVTARAVVPARRKVAVLARSLVSLTPAPDGDVPAVAASQYLIDAVAAAAPTGRKRAVSPQWWQIDEQIGFVVDLFERLEQRESV